MISYSADLVWSGRVERLGRPLDSRCNLQATQRARHGLEAQAELCGLNLSRTLKSILTAQCARDAGKNNLGEVGCRICHCGSSRPHLSLISV